MTRNRKNVLFYTFVFMFVVTFAVTIMGITDLITIRDGYLNVLFTGLVMELVAAVIGLFKATSFFDAEEHSGPPSNAETKELTTGLEFFSDRSELSRARDLDHELRKARALKMLFVGGSKIIEERPDLANVKKALLPHPESTSLLRYAQSVGDQEALPAKIRATTTTLIERGVSVRWYQDAVGYALIIADPTESFGWAQVESVFPYAALKSRPCFVVSKQQFSKLVTVIDDSFEKMFEAADPPH